MRIFVTSVLLAAMIGCVTESDTTSDDIESKAKWTTEAEIQDATKARSIREFFEAKAERGSFVSDHAKVRDTPHQGTSQVKIAYAIVRAPKEKGAIVLVNGRTESYSHYSEVAYDFARNGYTVYMLDHRGQGHSSRLVDYEAVGDAQYQKGHVDNFQDYVDDLSKFVDTVVLPERRGKPGLFALAHSMGGMVTTLYAEQHPSTFDAIALSSPMHRIKSSEFLLDVARAADLVTQTSYAFGKGPRDENEAFEGNKLTGSRARFSAKMAVFNGDPSTKIGGPTFHWIAESVAAGKAGLDGARKITAPVLLLQASSDQVVAPEGQQLVCDAIKAARGPQACTLVPMDGTPYQGMTASSPSSAGSQHEPLIEVDRIRHRELDLVVAHFAKNSRQH